MPELLLVRHAPTSWTGRRYCGRSDPPLDAAGRAVARALAGDLASAFATGTRIVSSPARRARETAAAIARTNRGTRIELDDRWSEVDFGIAEGLTFDELALVDPELAERLSRGDVALDWPAGETAASLGERVAAAWQDLLDHATPTILVSHGGPLRLAIALATGVPIERVAIPEPGVVVRLAAHSVRARSAGDRMLRF